MKKVSFIILLINLLLASYGQTTESNQIQSIGGKKFLLHQVQNGETIFSICKKFEVEQKDLIGANSYLISGLKEGETIRIPFDGKKIQESVVDKKQVQNLNYILHVVKKSETVYSICKLYDIDDKEIYKYNPEAEKGINENDMLRIPKISGNSKNIDKPKVPEQKKQIAFVSEDANFIYHKVQQGDSAFGISKKYNITVAQLEEYNPGVTKNLETGTVVKIPKKQPSVKPVVTDKVEYDQHVVEQGETFFSLKRKYGVSKEDLQKLNPEVSEGLKVGAVLKVPVSKKSKEVKKSTKAFVQGQHVVQKGQTFYSIAQLYSIDVDELIKANKAIADKKLKSGDILLLPKKVEKEVVAEVEKNIPEKKVVVPVASNETTSNVKSNNQILITRKESFRISMFLPLFFDKNISANRESISESEVDSGLGLSSNDSVSVENVRQRYDRTLHPDSRNFLQFYEGVLIAIDSLQKAGAKIELTLYDSEFSAKKVESLMQNPKLVNSDLIVGPVDVSLQKSIAAFCFKNQIPLVSPFSPDNSLVGGNPFYIQVNPTKDYVVKKTADYVVEKYRNDNIIVINHSANDKQKEARLAELVREKFNASGHFSSFKTIDYSAGGVVGSEHIRNVLKHDSENVIIVPATENRDEREAFLSRVMNNLQALSKEYTITLIGMSDYPRFKSINTENFHQVNLNYLTPNYIDYKSIAVNSFIRKYRTQFASEPTLYSFRGYDITWYFVKAFDRYGRNYIDHISNYTTSSLMSDFDFSRVKDLGGFMNNSLFIINLTPEFDVTVQSKYSDGKLVKVVD